MAYSCRYEYLSRVLAALDTDTFPELPECDEPAAYSTKVTVARDGRIADMFVRQCEGHDLQAHSVPGYERSIRLPRAKPDSDPIGVVEGDTAVEQYDNANARYELDA